MSITTDDGEEIPRTDICEECEREIVANVEAVTGKHDLIQQARETELGFKPVSGGSVTVRFSCRCSTMEVEYGPGSASAWDAPDVWLWEDEIDD